MPHFTLTITPQGPVLTAYIAVSHERRTALTSAAMPIPNPVAIQALVDTGASCTCVDPSVLTTLNLTPTGNTTMNTPSTGNTPISADQYDIGLIIPGSTANQTPLMLASLPVICAELLLVQGFHALIGRDVLRQCILSYNGTTGLFTIAY